MDIFDGLHDRYDALIGAFRSEDKKKTDRLEAKNLSEGYGGEIEGSGSNYNHEKLGHRLAEGLIPRDFEETLSLQSGVGSVIAKWKKVLNLTALSSLGLNFLC